MVVGPPTLSAHTSSYRDTSQPEGRPALPSSHWQVRAAHSLGAARAGRDLRKAGLASAQMVSGRWTWQPLWMSPQQAVWPGQPEALAEDWPIC